MTPPRDLDAAMSAVEAARQMVEKQGGTVNPDGVWDAAEMALDGCSVTSPAERIKRERAEPYRPEGGWAVRGR